MDFVTIISVKHALFSTHDLYKDIYYKYILFGWKEKLNVYMGRLSVFRKTQKKDIS